MTWSKLQNIIKDNKTFILSSHVNPDGDCICSMLALYWYITSLGKEAVIYTNYSVPKKFLFLKNTDKITDIRPDRKFDVFTILDASNPNRLGWEGTDTIASSILNIDHHRDNSLCGDLNIIDHSAAATSQILYQFFKDCNINFPTYIAETLYTGILTDTGAFAFSNTNNIVLRICADLAEKGVNCSEINRKIYSSFSTPGLLLRAKIWSSLKFHHQDRICSMEIPIALIDDIKENYGDIEGMSDQALRAEKAEVGMFLKYSDTKTHFSLRSKGTIDVGKIAQSVPGGGGHTCAAGCTIDLPLEQAKPKMLEIIKKKLR